MGFSWDKSNSWSQLLVRESVENLTYWQYTFDGHNESGFSSIVLKKPSYSDSENTGS